MEEGIAFTSATDLAEQIRRGEISSVELTRLYIDRIERLDGVVNAVIYRRFEQALLEAATADALIARGDKTGPLHGVPMTIKESYVMQDTPATWGIESQRHNIAKRDGLIVERFRRAGAHFLGKTNVPTDLADFQSYNPVYGTTSNPWNLDRTPGGSSGGSAAAMAAGFSALDAGSDIGGSIRTPAHFCGVYGHKPTWGIIPQSGHELIEGVPEPDVSVCGPLARSADDLKLALDIMAGPIPREARGWQLALAPADITTLSGLRVAIWATDKIAPVAKEIEDMALALGARLEEQGAIVSYTARPDFDVAKAHMLYLSLMTATMASGQPASYIEQMQQFVAGLAPDDISNTAINARAAVMSHRDWLRHSFRRERLRRAWDAFFDDWDILISPQHVVPAFEHDHRPFVERRFLVDGEEREYGAGLFWSGLANAPYLPSTVFPAGITADGLPVGLQATARSYEDYRTIEFARLVSEVTEGFVPPPGY